MMDSTGEMPNLFEDRSADGIVVLVRNWPGRTSHCGRCTAATMASWRSQIQPACV